MGTICKLPRKRRKRRARPVSGRAGRKSQARLQISSCGVTAAQPTYDRSALDVGVVRVQILAGGPKSFQIAMSSNSRTPDSGSGYDGANPSVAAIFSLCSPNRRGVRLKSGTVRVRVLPQGPISFEQTSCARLQSAHAGDRMQPMCLNEQPQGDLLRAGWDDSQPARQFQNACEVTA